jgi:hypothetical protein
MDESQDKKQRNILYYRITRKRQQKRNSDQRQYLLLIVYIHPSTNEGADHYRPYHIHSDHQSDLTVRPAEHFSDEDRQCRYQQKVDDKL